MSVSHVSGPRHKSEQKAPIFKIRLSRIENIKMSSKKLSEDN